MGKLKDKPGIAGIYYFFPLDGINQPHIGLSSGGRERFINKIINKKRLTAVKSILDDCIKRGASFEEFKLLAKKRLASKKTGYQGVLYEQTNLL